MMFCFTFAIQVLDSSSFLPYDSAMLLQVLIRDAPDLDPDGYKDIRIRQNPDPAGSKQSGSGQPDSLPYSSTNHCKHALFYHPMSGKCKIFKWVRNSWCSITTNCKIVLSFMIRCFAILIGCNSALIRIRLHPDPARSGEDPDPTVMDPDPARS